VSAQRLRRRTASIARQLLQLGARFFLCRRRRRAIVDDLEQRRALTLIRDGLAAFLVAELECELGHRVSLQCLNGKRNARQRARLVVVLAVVLIGDVHSAEHVDLS